MQLRLLQKYENACICHFDRREKSFGGDELQDLSLRSR